MHQAFRKILLLAALTLPVGSTGGCATIVGTAVSPFTGAFDLTRIYMDPLGPGGRGQWYWTPFVFIGGMIAGPFVALYNGVALDVSIFESWHRYWNRYGEIFRPFTMLEH